MDVGQLYPVRWYKPGDDLTAPGVPGSYRVDSEGRIEAHVHEMFDGERVRLFDVDPDFPTLLKGNVMGQAVMLVGTRVTEQRGGLTHQRDATLTADYALEGFGFLDPGDLAFTDVRLRFADQEVWTGWDRFAVMADDQPRMTDLGAVLREVPELEAQIADGTLSLVDGSYVNQEHDNYRWVLQSRSYFEFRFHDPVPIAEIFDRFAYPLQVMLMSASGRLPGVTGMAGQNTEWDFGKESDRLPSRWFEVRRFHGSLNTPRATDLKYLHRLGDLDFAVHMPALLDAVDRHRFALGHYGVLHSDRIVGGHLVRFGIVTQLIDAFDRTLHPLDHNDRSFEVRVKRLEDESGHLIDSIIGNKRWRNEVAKLRNLVIHGDVHAHEILRDQRPLMVGYEALLLLFEVRFLVEIGLSPAKAKSLATGRVHYWTIKQTIIEHYPTLQAVIDQDRRRRQRRKCELDPRP